MIASKNRSRDALLFSLSVAICLAALVLPIIDGGLAKASTPSPQPVAISENPPSGTYFDHLVFIIMENEGINDICGQSPPPCNGSNTPYMSALANQYGIDQQYLRVGAGTSQPQYIAIMAASQQNCTNGCGTSGTLHAVNLVDRLESAGLSWKAYMEDQEVSSGCVSSDTGFYQAIHNPFVSFNDIFTNPTRCSNIVLANPSGCGSTTDCSLINDLNSGSAPNFMWLTPNNCDNMHAASGCPNGCTSAFSTTCLKDGDNYLKSVANNILNSTTFKTTNSALFITFDEGNGFCPGPFPSGEDCMYNVWSGPSAKTAYFNSTLFNHYSFTKTIETNWGLSTMTSNDASATPMTAFLKAQTSADFSISANPTSINVLAGAQATSTITLNSLNSFTGTVSLAASSSPAGPTLSLNPTSVTLTSGGSGTSTLAFTSATTGNYTITVTGTSGSLQHTMTITVHVQDYSITSNPTSIKTNAGTQGTSTITVSPINHFAGTVSLSVAGTTGLTVSISPTTIAGGSGSATLAASSSTTGNYTATITSTSGTLTHTLTVNVQVVDFTISATSPAPTSAGASTSSTITIAAVNHFTGIVSLTDTVPSGLTCGAISPTSVTGSGTATVSCNATVAGNYTLTVTGTGGSLTHSAIATFKFTDFAVAAGTPATATVGSSETSTITIAAVNHFTGTISLTDSVPTGLTCGAISPTSVTNSGTATVSCSATSAGNYVLAITGTSGLLTHSATVTFAFTDFNIAASSPAAVTVSTSTTSTITITAVDGFTGTVSLTDTVPTGLNCGVINPSSVTGSGTASVSCSATAPGNYTLTVTGTNGSLAHSSMALFQITDFTLAAASPAAVTIGTSATSMITVAAVDHFAGTVALTDSAPSGLTCGTISPSSIVGSGTAAISCNATAFGNYTLTITGTSGSLTHTATALFQFRDYTITANPTTVTANAGTTAASTITIMGQNGFAAIVNLATNSTSCSLNPTSVTGTGSSTLSCTFASAGTYHVAVTGSSGALSHIITVTFNIQNFTIAASPTIITVNAGSPATSTITVASVNGFAGVVNLTTNSTLCTLTPSGVTGSGSSTLSCTFPSATTTSVKVTGTSMTLLHAVTLTFTVQDFTITTTAPAPANVGTTVSATITLNSLNQFAGTISLTGTIPTGLTCSTISPSSITGSGTATLSCTASTAGNYTVTITGTSSNLVHSTSPTFRYQDYTITAATPAIINARSTTSSTLTIGSLNGFNSTVSLSDSLPAGLTCSTINPGTITGSGTATISCSAMAGGNYTLTLTTTSTSLTHSTTTVFRFADFTISATAPAPADIGKNVNSVITVSAINQFSTPISLSASMVMAVSCNALSPSTLPGAGTSTLTCSANTSGSYTIQVRGTAGSLSHTTVVIIKATDYVVSSSPTSLTSPVTTNSTSTITLTSLNGYDGNITLTASIQTQSTASGPGGLGGGARPLLMSAPGQTPDPVLSPASIILSSQGTGHSTLTIIVPTGTQADNYTIIVTGTDGTLWHSVQLVLDVTDFSFTSPTSTIVLTPGANSTTTLSLQSLNSFQGNVTFSTSISPSGPTATNSPSQLYLTSASSTMLTVSVPSTTPLGNYTLTVQAASGSLIHTISIIINVKIGPTSIFVKIFDASTSIPVDTAAVLALLCLIAIQVVRRERTESLVSKTRPNCRQHPYPKEGRVVRRSNLVLMGPIWIRPE